MTAGTEAEYSSSSAPRAPGQGRLLLLLSLSLSLSGYRQETRPEYLPESRHMAVFQEHGLPRLMRCTWACRSPAVLQQT
jgi:hypothetical protein